MIIIIVVVTAVIVKEGKVIIMGVDISFFNVNSVLFCIIIL